MAKNPNFRLQRLYSDGRKEEPMLYELRDIEGNWNMSRRGFLVTAGIATAVISGCDRVKRQAETRTKPKSKPERKSTKEQVREVPQTKPNTKALEIKDKSHKTITGRCESGIIAHRKYVRAVCFSPNGKILASSSDDHTIK